MARSLGGNVYDGHDPYTFRERLAGVAIMVVAALLIVGAVLVGLGRDFFRDYNSYFIVFNDGYGLKPGVKVRFLGLEIGNVKDVRLLDNNKIRMDLLIQSQYASRIKGDSLATVKSPTIIGQEYINVTTGSEDTLPIPNDGQIPAQDSQTIEQLLASLELSRKVKQLEGIIANVTSIMGFLDDRGGPVKSAAENVRIITDRVVAGEGSLGAVLSRDEAYLEIVATLREIREVSASLNATAKSLNADVPDLTGKVDTILRQVETGTRTIPEVARGTREGIRDANKVLDSIKNNFLIRSNLPRPAAPENLTRPLRNG
ncbi:MAG: MlaD family protein [Deltaproteobacteria bacterium]|jgi:phospholipid/cholesterol/gamma-HCH transport system substrate-binding protein|nr:MlaD family protein [Deltaproteobacteria bacterium]